MDITVLASGSKGNCYAVSDGRTNMLLECGIPLKEIQKRMGFTLHGMAGCLLSHEHKDHAKAIHDLLYRSMPVYASKGTLEALNAHTSVYARPLEPLKETAVGTFIVKPFPLVHDSEEPLGYLIYSRITKEKLVFITDAPYCKYIFTNLTHIMVECNYCQYDYDDPRFPRIVRTHMGLENCVNFLLANDLGQVKQIYLLHMSAEHGDEKVMKESVQKITGKHIIVAGREESS